MPTLSLAITKMAGMALAIIFAAPPGAVDMAGAGVIHLEVGAPWGSGTQALVVTAAFMAHILRPDHMGVATKWPPRGLSDGRGRHLT
jgi:hypothetical protein